jgi:hypothetical protein
VNRGFLFSVCILPFLVLATLNSAGYRYGASDQAFYLPAVLERLEPALFPRDSGLIQSQARLTLVDESVAAAARATGLSLPALFAMLYVAALALLAWGALSLGGHLYAAPAASIALLFALTLRHQIAKTGTNTLEGYFHPRQLAFGLGVLAMAAYLKRGLSWTTLLPVGLAALVHPTTALWFLVWLGVAMFAAEPRWRPRLALAAAAGAAAGTWALVAGPLAGRLSPMDAVWLETLDSKDYLFPLRWPAYAWLFNLAYVPLILWACRERRAAGLLGPRERGVVAGCLSLTGVFAVALLLQVRHTALAIQLQPARVFWMLDFLATAYAIWLLAERRARTPRRAMAVAAVVLSLTAARGTYVAAMRFPERAVAQVDVRDDDWGRAMAWTSTTDTGSHWLADPYHAARYGTSVRVAGKRDVFVEEIKDSAIGMYDRDVAVRTRERMQALGGFGALTPARARELAARYDLDYLISEQPLELPVMFSSGPIRVYGLR